VRRLFATTTLALTFVAAPACDKKEEEKKDATAKAANAGKADTKKKDGADKAGADKAGADKAGADEAGADEAAADGGDKTAAAAPGLLELVPDSATMMVTVDLKKLTGSEAYKKAGTMLEQGDVGKRLAAAKACKLGPETWNTMVMGANPKDDDAWVMGLSATGIGTKETIECTAAKYKEADPKADWKIEEKDGRLVITINGGEGTAWAVDDDTLIMAGKNSSTAVAERVGGKGQAAVTGSLKDAMALAGDGAIKVAGKVTPDMSELAGGTHFEGFKAMAGGLGIPQPVVDSVKIEAKDANLTVALKASDKDVDALVKAGAGSMMMGAGGKPPM
jgi:hypothetical protein